jgi:tetratricopeptide (TPR) repeat protein
VVAQGCRPSGRTETAAGPAPPSKDHEAISLFGDKLVSPAPDPAVLARLNDARKAFEKDPSEVNAVWLGRRAAYAGRYREAIKIYAENLARFPGSYKLLRHRGHRYISIRQFGRAVADFEKAAELVRGRPEEIEPDGVPGPAGSSPSTVQFNIFYHLGLARYLSGDFAGAESAYRECLPWSTNDDRLVATTDWLYLTLRKLGKDGEARAVLEPVKTEMDVPENGNYHARLLMYKGLITTEALLAPKDGASEADRLTRFAIQAYGVGQRHLWNGEKAEAIAIFRKLLAAPNWSAFGYIAAEVELFRLTR